MPNDMPRSAERVFDEAQEEPIKDSVYDFLHCDTPRVGSFLSQFDTSGHLTGITQSENAVLGAVPGFTVSVGGGATVLGTGGNATLAVGQSATSEGSEGVARVYDPLWANALNFLDFLHERKLLNSVSKANIGQFVLVQGDLSIIDVSILHNIIDNTTLRKKLLESDDGDAAASNRKQRRAQVASNEKNIGFELVRVFPLTAQSFMKFDGLLVWSTLKSSALTVQYSDLMLQHGINIAGSWNMVAILDSHPTMPGTSSEVDDRLPGFITGLAGLIPAMRDLLGKPDSAFGVTPILIFREVSG